MTREFDITQYGAVGDGCVNDAPAIQQAIDDCAQKGGGRVYFPPGNFLSGTLRLRSNLTLHLEAGATLLGSRDFQDFELDDKMPDCALNRYFIVGRGVENVTIEGSGVIDGQGSAYWESEMINATALRPKKHRPVVIYLFRSKNIKIRDITIRNAPAYTVWPLGCDNVTITGVTIDNPRNGPNTDGLDIDCCSNIHISDCHIVAGDDCIALKSDSVRLGYDHPCENITVSNCTLSSSACGVRIGYEGDSRIMNCVFENLVIYDTKHGIDVVSILPELKIPFTKIEKGAVIEGIIFSGITMRNVNRAIYIWLGKEKEAPMQGKIDNISIRNIIASTTNCCFIGGIAEQLIRDVMLSNIKLICQGDMRSLTPDVPGVWGDGQQPFALYCRNIQNLRLHNVQVLWDSSATGWQNALKCEEAMDIEISNFKGRQFENNTDISAICLRDVKGAYIHDCNAMAGTTIFLSLGGDGTKDISLIGNNLSRAQKTVEFFDEADAGVFQQESNILP